MYIHCKKMCVPHLVHKHSLLILMYMSDEHIDISSVATIKKSWTQKIMKHWIIRSMILVWIWKCLFISSNQLVYPNLDVK